MKIVNLLIIASIIGMLGLVLIPETVSAHTGSGTVGDPYIAYDVNDLQDMQNHLSSYWELANDIDASATVGWNGGAGFAPVGTFMGHFDGNGYTISDLYISRSGTSMVGLFGQTTSATISNVTLEDCTVIGTGNVGGLIGLAYSSNNISYCAVTGIVQGTGLNGIGGLIGRIDASSTTAYTYVTYCFADVTVTSSAFYCSGYGGLIGTCWKAAVVSRSSSYGYVDAGCGVGGFVGQVVSTQGCSVTDCYTRARVVGISYGFPYHTQDIGGFAGSSGTGGITNCYSTGLVTCTSWAGCYHVGGLVGQGTCTNSFWDTQTSAQPTSSCGTGKTTSQMKTQSTFTNAGWDFATVWGMGGAINDGYPYLLWWYQPVWMIDDIYQVVWFQPNTMILGTELPNRMEEEDGIFNWGSNPAGISVVLSPFYSDYTPANITLPQDIITPQDMIGPTGNPGMTRDVGALVTNPLYPFVKMFADHWGATVQLWWIILTSLFVLICMVVTYRYLPHQMIVALVGGGLCSFFYAMGIYPFWVPLIFAVWGLAVILGERSPTV